MTAEHIDVRSAPVGCRDEQSLTFQWEPLTAIDGVVYKPTVNVLTGSGRLVECWRADWKLDAAGCDQVFAKVMDPGSLSAWHVHRETIDRLSSVSGRTRIVLWDGREESPTYRRLAEFIIGDQRPATITVPAGVWHGVQAIGEHPTVLLNTVDLAYQYERPDHFRLPPDSAEIPYRWQ
jgi:dTDP-4-dehydrorhamnose 3,5-epimerase